MQKSILIIFGVFCFSVCIRIPFLGQKLEGFGHQEWLAGHTLIILKIWEKEGIKNHHYGLPYTFYRKADKHIPFISGVTDSRGNGYYVSYPPFAFYLLYGITTILPITPNEVFLQAVTLLIQLTTGILLYILLRKSRFSDKIALLGASGYFLLPVVLRYHTQAYFCDILAQTSIVSTLILYQNYLNKRTLKNAVLTGLSLFMLTFTEWTGVFLTLTLTIHHLWIQKNINSSFHYMIWITLMVSAVILTLSIYSHIAGWGVLREALVHKANQRAVSDDVLYFSRWDWHTYLTILRYYVVHYYPAWISIIVAILTDRVKHLDTLKKLPDGFTVSLTTVLLHHTVFLNFTAENDFGVLKTSIPVLILWAFVVSVSKFSEYLLKMSYIVLLSGAVYVTCKGIAHKKGNDIQHFAEELIKSSPENEVLVLHSSSSISPQVMYYAQRNVYMNISGDRIKKHLKKYRLEKAVILHTDWKYHIQRKEIICTE